MVPILGGPSKATHLQTKNDADVIHCQFSQQALESQALIGSAPALTLIVVDQQHLRESIPTRQHD